MTLLYLSREMKTKKAETARYCPISGSTSEETSTNTSISIDLLLVNVSRPDTVRTEPGMMEGVERENVFIITDRFSLTFLKCYRRGIISPSSGILVKLYMTGRSKRPKRTANSQPDL